MDYVTAYEVINEEFDSSLFTPLIFIIIGFGISYVSYKFYRSKSFIRSYAIGFGIIFGLCALVFSIATIPSSFIDYNRTKSIYEQNDYMTVEGKIENFDSMPYGGHKNESFTLKGIEFNYSDFTASYYGFHNSASHGGPIKENGQEVRIGYIERDSENNTILKIELKE